MFKDKSKLWSGEAAAAANHWKLVKHERSQNGNCRTNEEDVIALQVKCSVKEMVTTKLATMDEESLDEILKTLFHKAQRSI